MTARAGSEAQQSQPMMQGKLCIITGASSGIGRVTALELARLGARLALVCRDRGRGEEAVAEIARETGNRALDLLLADLSSQQETRRVAGEILARYPKIDVLLNNAGVVNLRYSKTVDGIETVFAVNHLAYFLFTNLLLDRLRASAPARIVNVASEAHKFAKQINFDDLGYQHGYKWTRVYGQSKLANILFTYELARRLEGTRVTANCLHPGAVATRLGQNNGRVATLMTRMLSAFFRTPAQGAATSIYLASSPDVEGVTGKYFDSCKERRSAPDTYDEATQHRLWDVSAKMTGLAP